MEKIILTGKETKQDLMNLLDKNEVKYSKLDIKDKLLERISDYNSSIDVIGRVSDKIQPQSLIKETIKLTKDFDIEKEAQVISITGNQYCNIKGHNKRTKFFIDKKYKQELYPIEEWDLIFKKERLI